MRLVTSCILLLLTAASCSSNEIDHLQSPEDVTAFLNAKADRGWLEVLSESIPADTTTYGENKFFKLDLDANGSTDLLVNGKHLYAVTYQGNGKYASHFINGKPFPHKRYTLLTIIHPNSKPLLVVRSNTTLRRPLEDTTKADTLTLRFGNFIEYHLTPAKLQIRQIKFSTSGCFGSCPIFELVIQANRTAKYHAIRYNKSAGTFDAKIDTATYNRLVNSIQYLHLPTLKDAYQVDWSDDQTVNLEVVFSDGQVKKIRDYGAIGTSGLANLYAQLYRLRETQSWK